MNTLEAYQLGKKYPGADQWAVSDFSAVIAKGEIVALLGESGCGKTTILRMIAGFERPNSGSMILHGRKLAGDGVFVEPEKRGVGIVFQDYGLFPHKNVLENIRFGLFRFDEDARKRRAAEVIGLTGLEGLEKRYPHQLSGGQQQRVALARAIAPNPAVLLFDEPFSNLDSRRREQLRRELSDIIKQTGITSIFVTHDTRDVMAIADRVFVLRDGITLQQGTPAEVYNKPVNSYVANFFGKTNLLKATITAEGLKLPFVNLPAPPEQGLKGSEVWLSIRPEAFQVCDETTAGCFSADIIQSHFFGDYHEIACRPENFEGTLIIHVPAHAGIPKGQCCLSISSDGVNILKE